MGETASVTNYGDAAPAAELEVGEFTLRRCGWTLERGNTTVMSTHGSKFDLFLSHASEDRPVAQEMYTRLRKQGLRVWFDDAEITIGDSIRDSIDSGLKQSRYGVVVLSKSFLQKKWTKAELAAIFAREQPGHKVMLPVLHGLSADELSDLSPVLGDRLAANTSDGIESVVNLIVRAVMKEAVTAVQQDVNAGMATPSPYAPVPVILAGCGWWARNRTVFPLHSEEPDLFKVVGISNLLRQWDELAEIEPEFGANGIPVPQYHTTLARAIDVAREEYGESPLAVIINTPNGMHEELAHTALLQDCHVYAERPINRTVDDLHRLLRRARAKSRYIFNGVQRRLEPPFRYMFRAVRKKERFGRLASIRCRLASGNWPEEWRREKNLAGGGVVIDEGYHLLDAAAWMLEAAFPEIEFSVGDLPDALVRFGHCDSPSIEVETSAFGCVTLPEGVELVFDLSYGIPGGAVFEEIELRDHDGGRLRLTRDQTKRTKEPGRVLHQTADFVRTGFVVSTGVAEFSVQDDPPGISANNTGPLRQFLAQMSEDDTNAALEKPPLLIGANECDARFIRNTQALVAAIYRAVDDSVSA